MVCVCCVRAVHYKGNHGGDKRIALSLTLLASMVLAGKHQHAQHWTKTPKRSARRCVCVMFCCAPEHSWVVHEICLNGWHNKRSRVSYKNTRNHISRE